MNIGGRERSVRDERGPWIGTSWMLSTVPTGDGPRPRRRAVLTWAVGVAVLLGALGAAGPHPVTAALPLPPVDTSEIGATGRAPDAAVLPGPGLPVDPGAPPSVGGSGSGVPTTMLAAYRGAETSLAAAAPDCHLSWALVAGIGRVESSHAYGGAVAADGTTVRPILGPQLDGTNGNAAIGDTDGGALDHDATWDRAVGPTQFIPSSWRTYGADGNGDGTADPDNAFDAALATGRYLCAGGTDLATGAGRHDAVFRYNHSEAYVATVLRWADAYASGALPVPDSDAGIPDPVLASGSPTLAALPAPFPTSGAGPLPPVAGLPGSSVPRPSTPGLPSVLSAPAPTVGTPTAPGTSAPGTAPAGTSTPVTTSPTGSTPPSGTSPAAAAPRPTTPTPPSATVTPPSSTPGSTTPSGTTTPSTTPFPAAQRCTASVPVVAKAFGIPSGELKAVSAAGPKAGQVTCTISRGGKPQVVAVAATTASAPPPAVASGTGRTTSRGRVALSVPTSAGVPAATATAVLKELAATWA